MGGRAPPPDQSYRGGGSEIALSLSEHSPPGHQPPKIASATVL